jgi:hypothetical protein
VQFDVGEHGKIAVGPYSEGDDNDEPSPGEDES